jgi:hypothetical protein
MKIRWWRNEKEPKESSQSTKRFWSRRAVLSAVLIATVIGIGIAFANFTLNINSPATVNPCVANTGCPTATLVNATIAFPNGTAGPACTVSGTTATCPSVQIMNCGAPSTCAVPESGYYNISIAFTVVPAGTSLSLTCTATGPLSCVFPSTHTNTVTLTSTGKAQIVEPGVSPSGTGTGAGSASVAII